jgi:tripartite ATP-independent transporter DctM subunit
LVTSLGGTSKSTSAVSPDGAAPDAEFATFKAFAAKAERVVALAAEIPGAVLVIAEVAILFSGVTFRYVLHQPLLWSDELAGILFLWMSMLGAAVAQHRGGHMRLTVLVGLAPERWQQRIETFSSLTVILFLGLMLYPAWEHAWAETAILTPALGLPDIWKAAAIFAGCILMLTIALLQLVQRARLRDIALSLALLAACGLALWLFEPQLYAMGNWSLLIFFGIGVAVLTFAGAPIAISFGLAAVTYFLFATTTPISIAAICMDEGMSGFLLLSIPLFVLLGLMIEATGLAAALAGVLAKLVAHFRGGMSYVLIAAMYLVSGISGSKAANMAAIAPVLLPEMQRRGKKPGELIGLLSASAAMGETIPPSIVLITVGSVTGVSISALFTGGMLPAVVGAFGLFVIAWFRSRSEKVDDVRRATLGEIAKALLLALPPLLLLVVVRMAVVTGMTTATEVSTIGVLYTIIVSIVFYRSFRLERMWPMLCETLSLSGAIMIILGTASAMAWALTQAEFSHQLAAAMEAMPGGKAGFMVLSIVVFAILGSILEGIPAIVVFAPLLFPIAKALGIAPVHYGIVMVLSMSLGLFTPPLGIGFYQACAIGRVSPEKAVRAIWVYMLAILLAVAIVAAVPWLTDPRF